MGFQNGWRGPDIVSDGLVLYLDAGSPNSYRTDFGTTWKDMSGFNNSGSLVNGPTYSSANGGSIVFDGVNDYIGLGTPSSLNILSNITINSWVKVTSFPTVNNVSTIYEKGYDNTNDQTYFRFINSAGSIFLDVGTYKDSNNTNYRTVYAVGSTISLESWYNIVGQHDGANWNLYLNGRLISQTLESQGPLVSTSPISIGAAYISTGYQRFLNGKIALVQIYNRALSASEIEQNYNALKSRFGL